MGDNGPSVDYLYETPDTGKLQIDALGKAYRAKDEDQYTGASLSGHIPRYGFSGQKGMGGSITGDVPQKAKDDQYGAPVDVAKAVQDVKPHHLTPEELLAWADQQQAELTQQHMARMAEGPAVHPVLDGQPPDWLTQYMDTQGPATPYHEPAKSGLDIVNGNKYLTEQEKLRYMRFLQKGH
jgi:hypothetical protein